LKENFCVVNILFAHCTRAFKNIITGIAAIDHMANPPDTQNQLAELFKKEKCYTIDELSRRLNYSLISIRRFLKAMGYYYSYTHTSKWYTLRSIPSFNKNGI